MNIVIEINHPGQVHLLKNIYQQLIEREHSVTVFVKNEEVITGLLNIYKIPFINLGNKGSGISGKLFRQLVFDLKIWRHANKYKSEIGLGSSITNDHVSLFSRLKSIHLSDDDEDVVPFITKYSYPFADTILAPDCLKFSRFPNKVINYAGYHELAYLHPKRFKPDEKVIDESGLKPGERFFLMRFNAFKAHHDVGVKGLSIEQKLQLVEILSSKGKVFITTEKEIEPELVDYKLKISPDKVHSLLYYATLFVGDSQTMTSEAAVLGTPAIRCNTFVNRISYLEEEEHKYGLTFGFRPDNFNALVKKVHELLNLPNLKEQWQIRRLKMLADKIDVTAFMVWFVENYPESKNIMKENPDYQFNFR
jgi:hypothetical protein